MLILFKAEAYISMFNFLTFILIFSYRIMDYFVKSVKQIFTKGCLLKHRDRFFGGRGGTEIIPTLYFDVILCKMVLITDAYSLHTYCLNSIKGWSKFNEVCVYRKDLLP